MICRIAKTMTLPSGAAAATHEALTVRIEGAALSVVIASFAAASPMPLMTWELPLASALPEGGTTNAWVLAQLLATSEFEGGTEC